MKAHYILAIALIGYEIKLINSLVKRRIDWLLENRPPEPERLAVCHGDFHPLNILVQDGIVTGVLDWPGFIIADPALDIANTIVLSTIPFKHIAPH